MRWLKAAGALLALAFLVAGPPALLARYVGNPWPAEGLDSGLMSDPALIGLLACLFWLLWAQFIVCVVVEVVTVITGATIAPRIAGTFGAQQHAARTLVTVIAVALTVTPTLTPRPAAATPTEITPTAAAATVDSSTAAAATVQTEREPIQKPQATKQVTSTRDDTVWSLAQEHLGDGERFEEIARLNEGKPMGPGQVFRSSERIQPGWSITIPVDDPDLAQGEEATVTVEPDDNLSYIAQDEYGTPNDWPRIWDANKGRHFDDGRTFTDPDLIQPGWELIIPRTEAVDPPGSGESTEPPEDTTPDSPEAGPQADQDVPTPAPPTVTAPEAIEPQEGDTVGHAAPTEHGDSGDGGVTPSWQMVGLVGAGSILAGSLLLLLRARRRNQIRVRRPGLIIATPSPELVPVEKAITAAAQTSTVDIEHLDLVLRELAAELTQAGESMPRLAAVELRDGTVSLHLREPAIAPEGWQASPDHQLWTHRLRPTTDQLVDQVAPWPLLVPIGHDDTGGLWLLNCEDRHVSVTGNQDAIEDFARHIAAGIACNPWSTAVTADLVGIAHEAAAINAERLRAHDTLAEPARSIVATALNNVDRLEHYQSDTTTARADQNDPDPWLGRLVIAGPACNLTELNELTHILASHPEQTATAVINCGHAGGQLSITISEDRHLTMANLDTPLRAVRLTADEAHGSAALLAQADNTDDQPAPDLDGQDEWTSASTTTGALRDEHTTRRDSDHADASSSLLPGSDEDYQRAAAVTADDLAHLAPRAVETVRPEIERLDPCLDADLHDWFADSCARPRLTLLGPVQVRANGKALDRRRPFYTELVAYLATRSHGATPDEVADAFSLTTSRARIDVNKLREWLGNHPRTGTPFVPDARQAPEAQARGVGVYQIVDLLTDIDLFRRLRVRGQARGEDGIEDLRTALALVRGRPFDRLRPGGWTWLLEGDRLDHHMTCAIADVAHLIATHDLHAQSVASAREVVEHGLCAVPDDETLRLDLAAVATAEGHHNEARRLIQDDVCNRSDDGEPPVELSERTSALIEENGWLRARNSVK